MKEHQIIEISSEHKVLRTVLFAAAFLVAIGSVYFGLKSVTKKSPGWQEATASLDRELPNFTSHFRTFVYLEGSSVQIRTELYTFNKLYTDNLKRVYKLLDAETEYEGYSNVATLNNNLGKKVKVSSDFYDILKDAFSKTLDGSFNLFSGPLYRTEELLSNAESYDEEWEKTRITLLKKQIENLSNFSVAFYDDYYVEINVSDDYLNFLKEYEFNYPVIDFGENYFFYKTVLMDRVLSDNGYSNCIFSEE